MSEKRAEAKTTAINYTEQLAEYCATLRLAGIPRHVQEYARLVILDGLGCGLFGVTLPWSKILTEAIVDLSQGGPSVVWGTSLELPADHAALLNGAFVQSFELDDYHREGGLHEGACVIPAALATADLAGPLSGADLLTAMIAGFEVGARVGKCVSCSLMLDRGWHSGSVVGTFAAAAAAGFLLKLTPGEMAHAFGIAGTQSGGLMSAQFGSMVKRMHHGRSAQSGVYAAFLAKKGYTGIERIFEEPYGGFCTVFTATPDQFDLNQLVDGLGSRFETEVIAIKPYSCNASIHSSLDAIRAIRERRPFAGSDVRRVIVRCTRATLEHVGWQYRPTGMTAAQLNLSFGIAAMMEYGDVFVDQYTEEAVRSPRLLELARKVSAIHEPAFDALGPGHRHHVELTIEFGDGSRESQVVEAARGSSARPLSGREIGEKFDKLAKSILSLNRANTLKEEVLSLETLADARSLSKLLKTDGPGENA